MAIRRNGQEIFGNLRVIRNHTRYANAEVVSLARVPRSNPKETAGLLRILFSSGVTFEVDFGDFGIMRDCVSRWRSIYGASLWIDGEHKGQLCRNHPELT